MLKGNVAVLIGAVALAGCAAGTGGSQAARPSIATVPAMEADMPPDVDVRAPARSDVASIIGQRAANLTRRFGDARIDLTEGPARKLQFAGRDCVLDVFLYSVAAGTEPVATHVDARLRASGADTDKAACIAQVERR